ncbi:MAG: Na/Pi symporter, partial [Devosia sp.]
MNLYLLLLHLAGAVTLLLWAVRMVRTGVERSQEPALRRVLRESKSGRLRAAGIGAGIAVLLQSSTAVAMLAAGFAGSGVLTVATGLALMLGADLGSAMVVQILSVDFNWLVPVLLLAGGAFFFKGPTRNLKQAGRVLIGISLILVSLQMIGQATEPLRESEVLPLIVGYLRGDFITAFLIGAAFTW